MEAAGSLTEDPAPSGSESAASDDLRLRLHGSRAEAHAARQEARRLARELALTRRLLKFAVDLSPPLPPPPRRSAVAMPVRATLLTARMIYHLDSCQSRGGQMEIVGWAFCPVPEWDGAATAAILLFKTDAAIFQAVAAQVPRPDVAAHYAGQPAEATGRARGLERVGFRCEVWHDSLPANVDLELALRLECAGRVCEHALGTRLRI